MKVIKEVRDKTPEENLAIAKIQVMMEDSFGLLSNSDSSPAIQSKAKYWFETNDCAMWCDMAGTTYDHVLKLFQNLQYNYNSGKITKDQLRFGIKRLEKKL
tara:strand:+ start:767 stop:1069 length:303 start_codon:yes stop_codon:yes gene_type:complete